MAAQLTDPEILAQEIQKMEERKTSLLIAIKAAQASLKEWTEKVTIAEKDSQQGIRNAQLACEQASRDLTLQLDPLKSEIKRLKSAVSAEETKVQAAKKEHDTLISERAQALSKIDQQYRKRADALASVETSIGTLKQKVSEL